MINLPLWSAIIPTYGEVGVGLTEKALSSLRHTTEPHEIIVVDDGSSGGVQEQLNEICDEYDATFKALSENSGFAKACNAGIELSNGRIIILYNNDVLQIQKSCDDLANFTLFSNAGIVGAKLLYKDKTIQHAGVFHVPGKPHGYWDHIARFMPRWTNFACRIRRGLVTGAFMAINRNLLDMIGPLDERYGMAVEDIDLQLRCMETGRRVYYCGIIEAYHLEGQTRGRTVAEKAKNPKWTEAEKVALETFFMDRWIGIDWSQFEMGATI